MKDNKDFDFIKNKFEAEGVSAPESLSEERIKEKITKSSYKKPIGFTNKKRAARAIVSAVACIAIIIGTTAGVHHYNTTFVPKNVKDGIVYFDSYGEVERMMKTLSKREKLHGFSAIEGFRKNYIVEEFYVEEKSADSVNGASEKTTGFAKTNVQVEGIDEADIIKTDGKYIYYVNAKRDRVMIYSANGEKTKLVSNIYYTDGEEYLENIFLDNNKLYILGTTAEEKLSGYKTKCFCKVYNLDNINDPKLVHTYYQSGNYVSARLFNNTIYLVSDYAGYYNYVKNDVFPYATNDKGDFARIPYSNYYAIKDCGNISYSVLGAIDISHEAYKANTKALFGTSEDIYCSENNIYLFGTDWRDGWDKTKIVKFSLNGNNIKIKASGKVKGKLIGQYALDEKYGNLRVATTSYNSKGDEVNNLFVLDEKLNEIGKVSGFARQESIRAVKYIGDTAYVITFEQTDPLFVIDLKEPENPRILGEAKVEGFSTLLMPVDENTLLGIGYSTERLEDFDAVRTNGLKLTLFDISDKVNPKVLDEKEFKGYSSAVQDEPKALVKNESGTFMIPASADNHEKGGAFLVDIKDKKIVTTVKEANLLPNRLTYIGKYIYLLDPSGNKIEVAK